MKCLVTGGAGFIGSNLVRLLVKEGNDVTVLDDLSTGCRENLNEFQKDIRFVQGSVRDLDAVNEAVAGAEVIYHLAASVGNARSIANPILDSEINVMGTLQVLEAARRHKCRKVVFSSSAGIFGELKTLPIREDHPAEPDSPYGASKLGAEKLCLTYSKIFGLETVCLRYFNVYGVNQRFDEYGNVIPIFANCLLHNQPITIFGDGEQTRDFVNVLDVARVNYLAGQSKGIVGAFNIGSGSRVTIKELAQMMVKASGLQSQIQHGLTRQGDVVHSLADISMAKRYLGFQPTITLTDGLYDYMKWCMISLAG